MGSWQSGFIIHDSVYDEKTCSSIVVKDPDDGLHRCPMPKTKSHPVNEIAFNTTDSNLGDVFAIVTGYQVSIYLSRLDSKLQALMTYYLQTTKTSRKYRQREVKCLCWTYMSDADRTPLLCVSGPDAVITVLNLKDKSARFLQGHGGDILSLAAHPVYPGIILSCSKDHSLRLWNAASGCCIARYHGISGHSEEVHHVVWCDDGKMFVSCDYDRKVKSWLLAPETVNHIWISYYMNERQRRRPDGDGKVDPAGNPIPERLVIQTDFRPISDDTLCKIRHVDHFVKAGDLLIARCLSAIGNNEACTAAHLLYFHLRPNPARAGALIARILDGAPLPGPQRSGCRFAVSKKMRIVAIGGEEGIYLYGLGKVPNKYIPDDIVVPASGVFAVPMTIRLMGEVTFEDSAARPGLIPTLAEWGFVKAIAFHPTRDEMAVAFSNFRHVRQYVFVE